MVHGVRWIVMVFTIGSGCRRSLSLRHLRINAVRIVLMRSRTARPVRISSRMELAMWETMILIRMMAHHITVRSKVGCGLTICSCRESVGVVWKIISSHHVLLKSSFVQFVFEGLLLSSFRIFLHHLLVMKLLLFFSPLFNPTLHISLVRILLRVGQIRL